MTRAAHIPVRLWTRRAQRLAYGFAFFNLNSLRGRAYVPDPQRRLAIEPVSFCNLKCRFCSYPKNVHPRTVMPLDLFQTCVDQAAALGIRSIPLTPINGDVFMDKRILEKFRYLEDHPGIRDFLFYTNFIGISAAAIDTVLSFNKLSFLEISVYGHDEQSFCAITGSGAAQFRRLLDNLDTLVRQLRGRDRSPTITLGIRTGRRIRPDRDMDVTLRARIEELRALGVTPGIYSEVDDWGGLISNDDVRDIDMDLIDARFTYKKGPCSLPFDTVQITASGRVNACACRDPSGSLFLGDIGQQSLSEILGWGNRNWRRLIENQMDGVFEGACRGCSFYRSVYDKRWAEEYETGGIVSLERAFARKKSFDGSRSPGTSTS